MNGITTFKPTREQPSMREVVADGLSSRPYYMSTAKYFYDEVGAQLFDEICSTPEYYLTRTEDALLKAHAAEIIGVTSPDHIIEFGCGISKKVFHLLDVCAQDRRHCSYSPQDICTESLEASRNMLESNYPWLNVNPLCGDYLGGLGNLRIAEGRRLALFLGSTIGNFPEAEARAYLDELYHLLDEGDYLLLGVDRLKPKEVLTAAYDDAAGRTAEFNVNLLRVLNRELGADFQVGAFSHRAVFNEEERRMEMHLASDKSQVVYIGDLDTKVYFERGDTIRTEISRKFDWEPLCELLHRPGFRVVKHYRPENKYFSLVLAERMATRNQ